MGNSDDFLKYFRGEITFSEYEKIKRPAKNKKKRKPRQRVTEADVMIEIRKASKELKYGIRPSTKRPEITTKRSTKAAEYTYDEDGFEYYQLTPEDVENYNNYNHDNY